MRVAVVGLGNMGRAFSERLVDAGNMVTVWNRTPGRAPQLVSRGVREMTSPDDLDQNTDAVFLCLAEDASVQDIATPVSGPRSSWQHSFVVCTSTVSPSTLDVLKSAYGDRFLAAPVLGAPAAVQSGQATLLLAGSPQARAALSPLWKLFGVAKDLGPEPATASVIKLLNTHMLLAGITVFAETVKIGRAAGVDDETLADMFDMSPTVPAGGLRTRLDGLFDPGHAGWFTSPLAAKDLTLALGLAGPDSWLPVTRAARDAYLRVAGDGWGDVDITGVIELGRKRERFEPPNRSTVTEYGHGSARGAK